MESKEEICSILLKSTNKTISTEYFSELKELCLKLTQINVYNYFRLNLIQYTYPFLFSFGIVGNLLSLYLIIKTYRSKRKENRNFLFYLSIVCGSDLTILILNGHVTYASYKGEVLLDALKVVLWRQASEVWHFTLYVVGSRTHEDVEFFRLNEVWTACDLPYE